MNDWGIVLLGAAGGLAFAGGLQLALEGRRPGPRSALLLALLLASLLVRQRPDLEVRWLPVGGYAWVRPWLSLVLALAFLGSCLPQLPDRRRRIGVGVLSTIVFGVVLQHGIARTASLGQLVGVPDPFFRTCRQTASYTCGAAAASTLLAREGIFASEAEMAERCVTNPLTGTDEIGAVKGLSEALGARPRAVELLRRGADEIAREHLPAMVSIDNAFLSGHWVVLIDGDDEAWIVADPMHARNSGGLRRISRDEFADAYQGVLIRIVDRP